MKKNCKFHKVSEKRFLEDWKDAFRIQREEEEIKKIYIRISCFLKEPLQEVQAMISFHLQDFSLAPGRMSRFRRSGWNLEQDWVQNIIQKRTWVLEVSSAS